MGLAILGLVFTTSYSSGFRTASSGFSPTLPSSVRVAFESDPTITLDPNRFAPIEAAILQQPNGQDLLTRTQAAQRDGVARGIDEVYTGSAIAGLIILVVCVTLREIPLRRSFGSGPREHLAATEPPDLH